MSSETHHRLVVLGSMDEFVHLVRMAQARGIYVIVCDGYADGPAKVVADKAYTIDVRDTHAVAQMCSREKVDGIISSFSDVLAQSLVASAEAAGLPTYLDSEHLCFLRDKSCMKVMFDELTIPYPRSYTIRRAHLREDSENVHYPLVTKPVDAYGSHGVFVVHTPTELQERFEQVAAYSDGDTTDTILAEEYNDGYEFNMMNWIVNDELVVLEIADREKTADSAFTTPHVSRITYPSRLTEEVLAEARSIVSRVARYVGLHTGPLCMQFFWSPERGIQVCECAGRIFGYEHELLELASTLTVEELLLDTVYAPAAIPCVLAHHEPTLNRIAAGLYFHGVEGTIARIEGIPSADESGIEDVLVYYHEGDTISHGVGAKPYVIRIYVSGSTYAEVDEITRRLFRDIHVFDVAGTDLLYQSKIGTYLEQHSAARD